VWRLARGLGLNVLKFGNCTLLSGTRQLLLDDQPVPLGGRAFDLLHFMARHPDRVIDKDELLAAVWPGVMVTENNLNVQVAALRRVLGRQILVTVPGRGFRFGMEVSTGAEDGAAPPGLGRSSIAVLPFENLSGDPAQDYLADGMAEDVITALARFKQLVVVARNSSFVFKHRHVDVRQVGRELGVRYVLEGSVRRAGEQIRLTAQLIGASQGTHLWAEHFDGAWQNLFALQDAITAKVVGAVEPAIRQSEIEQARRKRPGSLDAHDLWLRALPQLEAMQPQANERALGLLQEALAIDPNFAPALAYAAWCYEQRLTRQWPGADPSQRHTAIDLARRALALGQGDANVLAHAGFVLVLLQGDVRTGLSALQRACEINPNHAAVLSMAGTANVLAGPLELATRFLERSLLLSPADPSRYRNLTALACAHHLEGDHMGALELATESLITHGAWEWTWMIVAGAAAALGQTGRAQEALVQVEGTLPGFSLAHPIMDACSIPQRVEVLKGYLREAGAAD
jgi:adenylate cyclase